MFESIKELGLSGCPAVAALTVVCVCFVAWWNGSWPWTGIVIKKECKCNCGRKRRKQEDGGDDFTE